MESTTQDNAHHCDRMTRGIKRLFEKENTIKSQEFYVKYSGNKRDNNGVVNIEVRRVNGGKHVRVSRKSNDDNVSDKQNNETSTIHDDTLSDKSTEKTQNTIGKVFTNISFRIKKAVSRPNAKEVPTQRKVE